MTAHLHEEAALALELPTHERIEFCRSDRWVPYSRADQILRRLEDLLTHPKSLRMPSLLLVGRPNNGKSSIVEHFIHRHPVVANEDGLPANSIAWVTMPPVPTESAFWSEILFSLNIQHRTQYAVERKRHMVMEIFQVANTRLLAIDEMNHLANAGKEAAKVLAAIKNLSTAMRVPILGSGTQHAINALRSDPQLMTRFEAMRLEPWTLDREYLRFLASYETTLPLAEPSNLASRELAPLIFGIAGNTIGDTVSVLKNLAAMAIEEGKERIDTKLIEEFRRNRTLNWDEAARLA